MIPEFELPGHAGGMRPLKEIGFQFCSNSSYASEIYHDPSNKTINIMKDLITEMVGLFDDDVFNIGADEVSFSGNCDKANLYDFET